MNSADDSIRKAANDELAQLNALLEVNGVADIKSTCKAIFQLYKAFVDAGFDFAQALSMTQHVITLAHMTAAKETR